MVDRRVYGFWYVLIAFVVIDYLTGIMTAVRKEAFQCDWISRHL